MFDQTVQNQQPFAGYGYNPNPGYYAYQQPVQPTNVPKAYNILNQDEVDLISKKTAQFSLSMTKEEQLKAVCNHRNPNGIGDALTYDEATGTWRCSICGAEFKMIDNATSNDVQDAVDTLTDYFQTAKYMFYDIPRDAAFEYYQILGLVQKFTKFFDYAQKSFNQHEINLQDTNRANGSILQRYNGLGGFNPFMAQQYGYAPQGMVPQQPMGMPQQPMAAGYPQAAYGNPFGYPGAQGYQPAQPGFMYQPTDQQVQPTVSSPAPQVQAPVAAPTAPAPAAEATATTQVKI